MVFANNTNQIATVRFSLPRQMRVTPTQTYYNPIAANNQWSAGGVAAIDLAGFASADAIYPTASGGATIPFGSFRAVHFVADARF